MWRFALQKLDEHEERAALRARHFDSFESTALEAEDLLVGADQARGLRELAPEEENLLSALAWSAHARDGAKRGLEMACALHRLWSITGRFSVGVRTLDEQLARQTEEKPTPTRARAVLRAGVNLMLMGERARARRLLEDALSMSRALGDEQRVAGVLNSLAMLALFAEQPEDARTMANERFELFRRIGSRSGAGMARHNLGLIDMAQGRYNSAAGEFEAVVTLAREIGPRTIEALSLSALAQALVRSGRTERAKECLRDCLSCLDGLNAPRESLEALEAVAEWLLIVHRASKAAPLLAAADRGRQTLRVQRSPYEQRDYDAWSAELLSALGPDECARLEQGGAALSLDRALAAARALMGLKA